MAIAWFVCAYKTKPNRPNMRYCAMNDYTTKIIADGGTWAESEVLGGYAVVKVRAAAATLTTIANATGFTRIPLATTLTDALSSLSTAQRNALRQKVLDMGYTDAEITAALGSNLGQKTLGDVLRFVASRRLLARWDAATQQIVLDGSYIACRPISEIDAEVK
jgi:hypothetical protein